MKKRPRFLPAYVTKFRDRHGKIRYRYRRAGRAGGYFKGELGSDAFRAEYAAFEAAISDTTALEHSHPRGTVADLVMRYVSTPTRLGPTIVTQSKVRAVVDRFRDEHGHRYVADFRFEHIDRIIERKREKTRDGKRAVGGIDAARKLRKELVRLFDFAEKIGVIPKGSNPVRLSEHVRVAAGQRSTGFHTWSEDDIEQYRAHHRLGTNARLAMELMLWTGQRRSDAIRIGPGDILAGRVALRQAKGGKALSLNIAPQLFEAINAMAPKPGAPCFLMTAQGKPYSAKGFGNRMRIWCDDAGLPDCSAHGLRKAMMRRMADLGMANRTLKAVSGHSKDDMVAIYTEGADQQRLADSAIDLVARWESNPDCLTAHEIAQDA